MICKRKAAEDQVIGNGLAAKILLEEFNNVKYNFLRPYKNLYVHQYKSNKIYIFILWNVMQLLQRSELDQCASNNIHKVLKNSFNALHK